MTVLALGAGPVTPAHAAPAPDPGGDEQAIVPVPPPAGQAFGFNDLAPLMPERNVSAASLANVTAAAGANIHRMTVNWQSVEPERDVWSEVNWDRYTGMASDFRARGQRLLVTLSPAPIWARDTGAPRLCLAPTSCRYPPAERMLGEWSEYVSEVVKRIPDAVIETWNEPNSDDFWRPYPQPERWARLHATTYWAAKAADPGTTVLAGGLAGTVSGDGHREMALRKFLSRAYATGRLARTVDALSVHAYSDNERAFGAGTLFARTLADLRNVRNANGHDRKPFWITETGLSTSGGWALTPERQADGLIRLYKRAMTMPDVGGLIIHTAIDQHERKPSDPGYGFGVVASVSPFAPKPAYCEFAGRRSPNPPGGCRRIVDAPPPGDGNDAVDPPDQVPPAVEDVAGRRCSAWNEALRAYRRANAGKRESMVGRCVARYLAVRLADPRSLKNEVVRQSRASCKRKAARKAKQRRRTGRPLPNGKRAVIKQRCTGRSSLKALKRLHAKLV